MRLLSALALVALGLGCYATGNASVNIEAPTLPPVLESRTIGAHAGHDHKHYRFPVVHTQCMRVILFADRKVKLGQRAHRECFIDPVTQEHPAAGKMMCPVCAVPFMLNVDTHYGQAKGGPEA